MSIPETAIDLNLLPPQIRRLVACIGFANTLELLQKMGGQMIKLAARPSNNRIVAVIGIDAAKKLHAEFGERIDLPKLDKITIQLRNAEIIAACKYHSVHELVEKFGLSRRTIINICHPEGDTDTQQDLFTV